MSEKTVSAILKESDAVIITSATGISNAQMDAAPHLKIIAKCGGTPSNVDIDHATACGIAVSQVQGANTTSIAEYTVMEIIASLRHFSCHLEAVKKQLWRTPTTLLGHDLRSSVVGIVGLGSIGSEVLRRLLPFDCSILVYSPHARYSIPLPEGARYAESLEEMLPLCDVLTLHCNLTSENHGMIGKRELEMMKNGAILINTARGALVDETALAEALQSRKLSAAALDVYTEEPPAADHPLRKCDNVLLTPHSSGWTEEALRRESEGAARAVLARLKNGIIPGLLNPNYIHHIRKN